MFLDNKHTKKYMLLMESRKSLNRTKTKGGELYHKHHIIPKSMGGNNAPDNLVYLTPREHYIAHLLLPMMVISPIHKRSMYYALVRFLGKNSQASGAKHTSRIYQKILEDTVIHMSGERNPFYGKTHSEQSRKRMIESHKGKHTGEDNSFYGRLHSDKTKRKMSINRSIPIIVHFNDGSIEKFSQYKFLGPFLGMSEHLGSKLCKPQYSYLLPNYNITKIEKL